MYIRLLFNALWTLIFLEYLLLSLQCRPKQKFRFHADTNCVSHTKMSRTLVVQNREQNKSRFLAKVFDVSSVFSLPKTSTQLCSRKVTVNGILMVYLQFLQRRFGLENGKFH